MTGVGVAEPGRPRGQLAALFCFVFFFLPKLDYTLFSGY